MHLTRGQSTGERSCSHCKTRDRQIDELNAPDENGSRATNQSQEKRGRRSMDETHLSRGFRSKRKEQTTKNRLPPGQYVTTDFPVLSAGPTPQIKVADWTFALQLNGSLLRQWRWNEVE